MARRVRRGELPAPDDDELADRYELLDSRLTAAGLRWYEVSNWAQRGRRGVQAQPGLLGLRGLVGRGSLAHTATSAACGGRTSKLPARHAGMGERR